jgi:hypothetical protein
LSLEIEGEKPLNAGTSAFAEPATPASMTSARRVMIAPSTNRCDGMQICLVAFTLLPSSALLPS